MWPTTFMTGVNSQLSEMMTASHMSVNVFGNGGTRKVAPSIFSNGISQAVGPLLLTICSCCLALGLGLLLAISSTKPVSHEAGGASLQTALNRTISRRHIKVIKLRSCTQTQQTNAAMHSARTSYFGNRQSHARYFQVDGIQNFLRGGTRPELNLTCGVLPVLHQAVCEDL